MATFTRSTDAGLTSACSAANAVAGEIIEILMRQLPASHIAALDAVLKRGGRVGLEVTVDRQAASMVALVAIEHDGMRRLVQSIEVQRPTLAS